MNKEAKLKLKNKRTYIIEFDELILINLFFFIFQMQNPLLELELGRLRLWLWLGTDITSTNYIHSNNMS